MKPNDNALSPLFHGQFESMPFRTEQVLTLILCSDFDHRIGLKVPMNRFMRKPLGCCFGSDSVLVFGKTGERKRVFEMESDRSSNMNHSVTVQNGERHHFYSVLRTQKMTKIEFG